jgi:hypothetical protein
MLRRLQHENVIRETTVTRLKKSGDAETWLVAETSCEANGPEMRDVVSEALALLSAANDIDGVELMSTTAL